MKLILYITLLMVVSLNSFSQSTEDIDSISPLSYDKLYSEYKQAKNDSVKQQKLIILWFKKASKNKDTSKLAKGYLMWSWLYKDEKALTFLDSMINLGQLSKNRLILSLAHNEKAAIYLDQKKFNNSLNNYLEAGKNIPNDPRNKIRRLNNEFNIGLIRNKIGDRLVALKIFKNYIKQIDTILEKKNYLIALYALGDSYTYNKELDSAEFYLKKGLVQSLKQQDSVLYPHFLFSSGVNLFYKQKYNMALDSLIKSEKVNTTFDLKPEIDLYIGKTKHSLGNIDQSIEYFENVATYIANKKETNPKLLQCYNYLIEFYKKNNNIEREVYYTTRFSEYKAKFIDNSIQIAKELNKDHKSIVAIDKKSIEKSNNFLWQYFILLIVIISVVLSYNSGIIKKTYFKYFKNYFIKKEKITLAKVDQNINKTTSKTKQLPPELIEYISENLREFELSERFLKKNYTLQSLAEELKTNSTYLSKVVNVTKNCNFSTYINSLKLDYAINKLNKDKVFRLYTIKAIANDSGFKTAQTFTSAFYKREGIYPSDYIAKINY